MQRPPIRVNVQEHTVFGLTYRQVGWLAGSALAALALFFSLLVNIDLVARGTVAVLVFGLGAAVAFGIIDGQLPEVWLWHCVAYSRRSRYLVKGARRTEEPQAVLSADAVPEPAPAPAPVELPVERPSSFISWSVGAVMASLLVGLTLYMYTGGAARLAAIWHGI